LKRAPTEVVVAINYISVSRGIPPAGNLWDKLWLSKKSQFCVFRMIRGEDRSRLFARFWDKVFLAGGVLCLSALGYGADAQIDRGKWDINCPSTKEASRRSCAIVQTAVSVADPRRFVTLVVGQAAKGGPSFRAIVNQGVRLDTGVAVLVDGEQRAILKFKNCDTRGCLAEAPLRKDLREYLVAGKEVEIRVRVSTENGFGLVFDLSEFGHVLKAYESLAVDVGLTSTPPDSDCSLTGGNCVVPASSTTKTSSANSRR
jgi:invasion protein IalB